MTVTCTTGAEVRAGGHAQHLERIRHHAVAGCLDSIKTQLETLNLVLDLKADIHHH